MGNRGSKYPLLLAAFSMLFAGAPAAAQLFAAGQEHQLEMEGCAHGRASLGALSDDSFLAAWTFHHPAGAVHAVQRLDMDFLPGGYTDLGFGYFHDVSYAQTADGGAVAAARNLVFRLNSQGALEGTPLDLGPLVRQGSVAIVSTGPVVLAVIGDELRLHRLLPDLTLIDSNLVAKAVEFRTLALLRVEGAFVAIWSERVPPLFQSRIWWQRIDDSSLVVGQPVLMAEGDDILEWGASLHPTAGVGLAWRERHDSQIWFQPWNGLTGAPLGPAQLVHDTDLRAGVPSLVASPSGWVVGWLGTGLDHLGEVRARLLDSLGQPLGPSQALSEPMSSLFPGTDRTIWNLDLAVSGDRLLAIWGVFKPHVILPNPCEHYFSPRFREFRIGAPGAVAVPGDSMPGLISFAVMLLVSGIFLTRR